MVVAAVVSLPCLGRTQRIEAAKVLDLSIMSDVQIADPQGLESLVAEIAHWPVGAVSAAVFSPTAILASVGDLTEVYELASVTKLLTAYTALMAIEEEAITLEDVAGPDGATVEELLSHTGGVGFDSFEPQAPRGTKRIYSSAGYELVARHIQECTTIPYVEYFRDGLVGGLGMTRTRLTGSPGPGAESCVEDLVRFGQEILVPTLLHRATVAAAVTNKGGNVDGLVPGYGMQKPCPWGLGFEVHGLKRPHWMGLNQPLSVVGHFGQAGTYMWLDRKLGYGMVVLTNQPFGPWAKPLWAHTNAEIYTALTGIDPTHIPSSED